MSTPLSPGGPEWPSRVLVIGGSKGVGRRVVETLTERGSQCAIGYSTDDVAALETTAAAAQLGLTPVLAKGDMATEADAVVTIAAEALGGLDGIVVTAVPVITGRALSLTLDQHQVIVGMLMWGLLDAVRSAVPHFETAGNGSVVVVSSLGARYYAKYYGTLSPAKAAVEGYVRTLAAELGPRQIRVNGVAPCLISDELHTSYASKAKDYLAPVAQRTPLRRLATPHDIARAIVGLLGSDFGFVTGQVVDVDGGYALMG